ncbi:MAG: putative transposase [Acidimicrobiales bacterium]
MAIAVTVELEGMPERFVLERSEIDNDTVVSFGPHVLFCYPSSDTGLRNLAVVSLCGAGVPGIKVADVFGLSPEHVSRLRGRAKDAGSAGLVRQRGPHRKLSGRELARVRTLARSGCTQAEIATRLHVSQPTISRALSKDPGQGDLVALPFGSEDSAPDEDSAPAETPAEDSAPAGPSRIARIETGEVRSRYAGAMLLHHVLSNIGAEDVLSSLPRTVARRFDAPAVMLSATFGFALGSSSTEGTKHLSQTDAGALVGLASFPELRPRLAAIAEQSDPLRLQGAFARAMLGADEHPPRLYFVDDHFVTYTGARAVAKGWNTRKAMAERGRDDTFVVDDTWRAICFSSFEPKGLAVNLPPVIDQLVEICGERPIMVGFDRGGSFPKVFSALRERGVDWVTYRRAPLVTPTTAPRISWIEVDDKRILYRLADEIVELAGYGEARQLSLYEHDKVVFQILTSDSTTSGARLVRDLRARWCIENAFKYAEEHQGVHWLASYAMDEVEDDTVVDNPARVAARATRKTAADALAAAREALGAESAHPRRPIEDHLAALRALRDDVTIAEDHLEEATTALKGIPAKLARNEVRPGATRARPRIERRALQMVCRLLAYNAELDLARRLNAYLCDDDEYRGITRNLLHLGGVIDFQPQTITVRLDRPDPPRLARALGLLIEEINLEPPRLTGDGRPLTYVLDGRAT